MEGRGLTIASALAVIVCAAAPAWTQTTTGRLIGTVFNPTGNPLPEATITVDSAALIGGAQVKVTDSRGEFSFIGLAPGEYSVKAVLAGFINQHRGSVKVPLGGAANVVITMPSGTVMGEIEVIDETPVIDPTQVDSGQVFGQTYMQNSAIGSTNRDYRVVVNHAPGVVGASLGSFRLSHVFGSTIGENAYFMDGMDITDPVMGLTNVSMNFDALGEIQLLAGGYEAEHGRATGGIINLVTKSGGNQFSGTFDIRYRDESFQEGGDHFDTSELDTSFQQYSLTLGGPILRDRVWFFASYQLSNDEFTPIASPTTRDQETRNYLLKITWQAHPSWRVVGRYSSDPYTMENFWASRWVMPEAGRFDRGASEVFSTELGGVLSESLFWSTTLGRYTLDIDAYPMSGDLQTIGHLNQDTGIYSHNHDNQQYWTSSRNDFATDVTWFVDGGVGSHELKGGLGYSDTAFSAANCFTGTPNGERCVPGGVGFFFWDIEHQGEALPEYMWEYHTSGTTEYEGSISTAFLQDSWRPARGLTVKAGLRLDAATYKTNDGSQIADMDRLQPRLGFAWDVGGTAKNIVRGSWGRFMNPGALTLSSRLKTVDEPYFKWYSCSTYVPLQLDIPIGSPEECATAAVDLGWDYRLDHAGWDPHGWVLAPEEHYGGEPAQVDAGLRASYADELILAFEHAVGRGSSIELSFVDKRTRDIYEGTCGGNWPEPSADAECDFFFFGNIPGLERDYRAFVARYETRGLDWLTLLTSYTYSSSEGSIEYTQEGMYDDFDVFPWHFENRYGYLSDHRRHRFKLNGFVTLRGDWAIAFDGIWASPFTWTPYETPNDNPEIPYGVHYLEPRGSREANGTYQLDLQLSKGFTVGRVRLVLIGSAFNVFSNEQPVSVCGRISGCGDISMGEPTDWQTPRRYELGFRVEF